MCGEGKKHEQGTSTVGKTSQKKGPKQEVEASAAREGEGTPSTGRTAVGELNRAAASVIMTVNFAARWAKSRLTPSYRVSGIEPP